MVHENNHPTHDLQLAVVILAWMIWKHYLYVVHVDVFTDHKILRYLLAGCDMSFPYHLDKDNIVGYALGLLLMGSVACVEYSKKELFHYVDRFTRLGIRLLDSNEGSVIFQNGLKQSRVSDVKDKQDLDPIFVYLNKLGFDKAIGDFSQVEMWSFDTKVNYVF